MYICRFVRDISCSGIFIYFQMLARRGELEEAYMLRNLINKWDDSINHREMELWHFMDKRFGTIIEMRALINEEKAAYSNAIFDDMITPVEKPSNSMTIYWTNFKNSATMALLETMSAVMYGIHHCCYFWYATLAPNHKLHMFEKQMVSAFLQ